MWVIDGVVIAQYEPGWMTTIMLHSFMPPTAYVHAETWYTSLRFWKLLVVGCGNQGEWAGWDKAMKLGYVYQQLLYGSTCSKLPAKGAGTWSAYIISCSDNMSSGESEIDRPCSVSMQMFIHWNNILAAKNHCMHFSVQLLTIQWLQQCHWGECWWSVNNFNSYIFGNQRAA